MEMVSVCNVLLLLSLASVPPPGQNTSSYPAIVNTSYDLLKSHYLHGRRWGKPYHFYRPANTKYSNSQWLWDSGSHMIVWSHRWMQTMNYMYIYCSPNWRIFCKNVTVCVMKSDSREKIIRDLYCSSPCTQGMSPTRSWICAPCFRCSSLQDSSRFVRSRNDMLIRINHQFWCYKCKYNVTSYAMLAQEMIYWNSTPPAHSKFDQWTPYTQMPVLAFSLRAMWDATKASVEGINLLREFVPQLVRFWEW